MNPLILFAVLSGFTPASSDLGARSDYVGVYALVLRAELRPNADAPTELALEGVFSIADPKRRNDYLIPSAGTLCFKLAGDDKDSLRLKEWNDLVSVAGTESVVSFGERGDPTPKVHPFGVFADPQVHPLGLGVQKVRTSTDYAPIKQLVEMPRLAAPVLTDDGIVLTSRNAPHQPATARYRFDVVFSDGSRVVSPPLVQGEDSTQWKAPVILGPRATGECRVWIENATSSGPRFARPFPSIPR